MSFPLFVTFTEKATGQELDIDCARVVAMRNAPGGGTSLELDTLTEKSIDGSTKKVPDTLEINEQRAVAKQRINAAILEDNINYARMKKTIMGGPS